jgi:UDPglucose--hexose-1-phosphate uridylyltransferase
MTKRTVALLADGRQIIYFDEEQRGARELVDRRDLPPAVTVAQARYDPLLEEWVVLASHRQDRTHLPPVAECPLCPSTAQRLTEIPSPDYDVVVFENRFPSLGQAVRSSRWRPATARTTCARESAVVRWCA